MDAETVEDVDFQPSSPFNKLKTVSSPSHAEPDKNREKPQPAESLDREDGTAGAEDRPIIITQSSVRSLSLIHI